MIRQTVTRLLISFLLFLGSSSATEPLSLVDALYFTLHNGEQVDILLQRVEGEKGTRTETAEPFDWQRTFQYTRTERNDLQSTSFGAKTSLDATEHSTQASIRKQARLGTRFTASGEVFQSSNPLSSLTPLSTDGSIAVFRLRVEQPLLRNFLHSRLSMEEASAQSRVKATYYDALHGISETIFNSALLYWEAVAANVQLTVAKESEERAQHLLDITIRLTGKEEIPRADISQSHAQLEQETTRRIVAEQAVISSAQRLLFQLGYDQAAHAQNSVPDWNLDILPDPQGEEEQFSEWLPSLIQTAYESRYDLRSLEFQIESLDYLAKGAHNERLPGVDLIAEASSSNFQSGRRARNFYKTLGRSGDQVDVAVGVQVNVPFCNSGPKGRYRRLIAERERTRWTLQRQETEILTQLREAFFDYTSLIRQLESVKSVVWENEKIVENENKKLKSGVSTLFIVIDFENRLTRSRQQLVDLRKRYVQSIARLYFLSGSLVREISDSCDVILTDVTRMEGLL